MDESSQQAFELASAVYRVAKFCPGGEVLISKIKQIALDILADFIKKDLPKTAEKIEVLQGFFKLAQLQNWVNQANFNILDRGYQGLKTLIQSPTGQRKAKKPSISDFPPAIKKKAIFNQRQEQILKFLATKKEFRLKEIKKKFFQVSDKTLRNDLKTLVNQEFLKREGRGAGSVYKVIR